MKLLTKEIEKKLPALYSQEEVEVTDEQLAELRRLRDIGDLLSIDAWNTEMQGEKPLDWLPAGDGEVFRAVRIEVDDGNSAWMGEKLWERS